MFLRDKTYTILKKINDHDNVMSEQELSRHLTAVYSTDFLLRHKYICAEHNVYGEDTGIYHVDSAGYKYMVDHQKELRQFWMNFISQFMTGLITGSIGTLVLEFIILKLILKVQ